MATFSIGEALGVGFGVIGRRPLSVLAWGLAFLVLGVAPVALMLGLMGPDLINLFQTMAADAAQNPGAPPPMGELIQLQTRMLVFQPVLLVTSLLARAVLIGAIFRAVLEPENRGFASLRLGRQELWLALVMLVMGILIALVAVGLMLLCVALVAGLVFGLSSAHANAGWGALAGVIVGVAAVWAIIWVGLRWSLALPLTFAEGRFRLFESWALTRGHALKLFGLSVVLAVIVGVIGMVAECVLAVIVLSAVGLAHLDASSINAFLSQPPQVWLPAVAPWLALAAVAGCFIGAALATIFMAPWAEVYRHLAVPPAPPPAAPEESAQIAQVA